MSKRSQDFAQLRAENARLKAVQNGAALGGATSAAIVRNAENNVAINESRGTDGEIVTMHNQLVAKFGKAWADSLPSWIFSLCPDWFLDASGMRDVKGWDKARAGAIKSVQQGDFVSLTREDGSHERHVAAPITHAALLDSVLQGNMAMTLQGAPMLVSASRAKASKLSGRPDSSTLMLGGIQEQSSKAYAIIMAASELDAKTRAAAKTQAALDLDMADQKLIDRRDRAMLALATAQKAFDAAWAAMHAFKPFEEPQAKVDAFAAASAPIVQAEAAEAAESV